MLRPYLEKKHTRIITPIFVKTQVRSFLYYIRDEGRSLKNYEWFDLLYYQDNNTEHHKVIYPPCSRNCQILQKKTGNKINKNIAIPYN